MLDDVFGDIFGKRASGTYSTPDPTPEEATSNQARSIIYVRLMRLSRAMKDYGELLEKNTPKRRPQ